MRTTSRFNQRDKVFCARKSPRGNVSPGDAGQGDWSLLLSHSAYAIPSDCATSRLFVKIIMCQKITPRKVAGSLPRFGQPKLLELLNIK